MSDDTGSSTNTANDLASRAIGHHNPLNRCWLNAFLQVVLRMESFNEFILNTDFHIDSNIGGFKGTIPELSFDANTSDPTWVKIGTNNDSYKDLINYYIEFELKNYIGIGIYYYYKKFLTDYRNLSKDTKNTDIHKDMENY